MGRPEYGQQKPPTPPDSPDDGVANGFRRLRQQLVGHVDMAAANSAELPLSPESSSEDDTSSSRQALLSPYSNLRRSQSRGGGLGLSRLDMPRDLVAFVDDDYTERDAAHLQDSPLTSIYSASSSASPRFNEDFSPATCSPVTSTSSSRRPSALWEGITCDTELTNAESAIPDGNLTRNLKYRHSPSPNEIHPWPRAISSTARRVSAAIDKALSNISPRALDYAQYIPKSAQLNNPLSKNSWLFPRLSPHTVDLRERQLSASSHLQPPFSLRTVDKGKAKALNQDSAGSAIDDLLHYVQHSLTSLTRRPKRVRTRVRRLLSILVGLVLVCWLLSRLLSSSNRDRYDAKEGLQSHAPLRRGGLPLTSYKTHPISGLMSQARKDWEAKVNRQSKTADEAVAEYKRRYKRYPPEGFAEWFQFAQESGTILPDEYDSMMAALEPFWTMNVQEMRKRTIQIGTQPSFAVVHVQPGSEGEKGTTYWDANEDRELVEPFGVERARGFERMIRPFIDRPGMRNMAFAINELAEPRVLVPWEEQQMIEEALRNKTEITKEQNQVMSGGARLYFPAPIWQGDGTTWEVFKRTCPPNSAVRRELVTMTNSVIHEANVEHLAYAENRTYVKAALGRKMHNVISDTLLEGGGVRVEVNPARPPKRRLLAQNSGPDASPSGTTGDATFKPTRNTAALLQRNSIPRADVTLNTPAFAFTNNLTTISHAQICEDSRIHDTQGQFCSDFRSVAGLYPIFSPSSMPGFADIIIPSHYYASESPKYHLDVHINRVKKAVKDPKTGKWTQILAIQEFPKWEDRISKIFWRGSTTGGGNNPAGRQLMYQRHRFLKLASANASTPVDIVIPGANATHYLTHVQMPHKIANNDALDVAFTSLDGCGHEKVCQAVRDGQYNIGERVPLIDVIKYKLLADIDGMAYSARFMALFESKAAVIKSTIYSEYWSDQIQPWYHYIPLSMMYDEIYNIYAYFLGSPSRNRDSKAESHKRRFVRPTEHAHRVFKKLLGKGQIEYAPHERLAAPPNQGANDEALRHIAEQGYEWQKAFGQKKSMEVYCYRLALEWSRLWTRDGFDGFTQEWRPIQKSSL